MLDNTSVPLLLSGSAAFLGSFFMFVMKGGFTRKMHCNLTYKDEFLNTIDTIAYKHIVIILMCSMGFTFFTSEAFLSDVPHSVMATFYLAITCLVYGASLLWQSRD
ncbi:hypothetical protein [Pseudoalteromonas sp. NEC-BIFX-2020_002]|uniref:hypothetical protein n=1 Tax=Pseudoalteromonas sp. NEC-BIFX-2020_002 TaxID=2732353 RepID=UPI002016AC7A|nr:hypothetical protein [Pseudoalteromonas sp. NEC-BIFX-2020_002]